MSDADFDYLAHDALGLAECVREGRVTPEGLLEVALERIARLNPALDAVVHSMAGDALKAAADGPRGPFAGVPFLAKDLISTYAGHPTTAASRLLAGIPADHDSELARRVKATGVLVAGKTNLPEWGLVPYTESELYGTCRNPWDPERTPGGSSGGSAAAVAAGMVPMAGGGDGGGSIRIPASCCGLFGLKPTTGRTPTGPDHGRLWRGATVEHVLTRSVRDSAAMLDATHGPDPGAPVHLPPPAASYLSEVDREPARLRIGWTARPFLPADVHPDCRAALDDAVGLLEGLGHHLEEVEADLDGPAFARAFLTMVSAELAADVAEAERATGRKAGPGTLEPATLALALLGAGLDAETYATSLRVLERAARTFAPLFADHDVLLTPTLAAPPVLHGSLAPKGLDQALLRVLGRFGSGGLVRRAGMLDQAAADAFAFTPWTPVSNATGQPAMSVPLWWNDAGLPIGVHVVGRFADEATLFRLAGQLERARPWFDRLAPLARAAAG